MKGGGTKQSVGKCATEEEDKGVYIFLHFSYGTVYICGRRGFEKIFLLLIEGYIYFYFSAIECCIFWRRGEGLVMLMM